MYSHIFIYSEICDFWLREKAVRTGILSITINSKATKLTLKNSQVDPWYKVPYWTSLCVARSSGEFIGVTIRSTVRNAAKLAVYEEIKMSVKNHQTEPTIRPEMERGEMSQPCCMNAPSANQNELKILNSFTVVAFCWPLALGCAACPECCCVSRPSAIRLAIVVL